MDGDLPIVLTKPPSRGPRTPLTLIQRHAASIRKTCYTVIPKQHSILAVLIARSKSVLLHAYRKPND